jgi:hypothetical protein
MLLKGIITEHPERQLHLSVLDHIHTLLIYNPLSEIPVKSTLMEPGEIRVD